MLTNQYTAMDRGIVLLQGLREKLHTWFPYIKRSVHAEEVWYEVGDSGEFSILVLWKDKEGNQSSYKKSFTRALVFGGTAHLSPNAWAVERRACDHARDIVREVLQQRGVM